MIAVLVYGTVKMPSVARYPGEAMLVGVVVVPVMRWFTKEEIKEWMSQTWRMVKMPVPVILLGVFVVGIVTKVLPPGRYRIMWEGTR